MQTTVKTQHQTSVGFMPLPAFSFPCRSLWQRLALLHPIGWREEEKVLLYQVFKRFHSTPRMLKVQQSLPWG